MGEHKRQVAQISPWGAEEGKGKSGIEMTDDGARVEGRGEKMCEGRETGGIVEGGGGG